MNICAMAGRLARNAVLKGAEKKVLLFTLVATCGWDDTEQKDRVSYVPVVVFNPSDDLAQSLVTNGKGTYVELGSLGRTSSREHFTGERAADLQIGDTAGLETCATGRFMGSAVRGPALLTASPPPPSRAPRQVAPASRHCR